MASCIFITFLFLHAMNPSALVEAARQRHQLTTRLPSTTVPTETKQRDEHYNLGGLEVALAGSGRGHPRLLNIIHPLPKGVPVPPSGPGGRHNSCNATSRVDFACPPPQK